MRAPTHNLPSQPSRFIGREEEIDDVAALLATSRLVTLTSAGGTGKTRLSLQVAERLLADFPDGVWFVELAALVDRERVAQAVATVLGVTEVAGRPVQEALATYVAGRSLLVVLDNCEHVLPACLEVTAVLLACGPGVRILATSREPLNATGEARYAVPSLPESDAVRLFVDRAQTAQPSFALSEANTPAVASICRRLDGLPLALELAAAQVRSMSVDRINLLLGDCFRVLTGGSKERLPRQQTLRASIDWSYDLLDTPERILFRRLSVFAGGFTTEAAQAVCAVRDLHAETIPAVLTELGEKSLVEHDAGAKRYRLLETVRQYGRELLAISGENEEIRSRHVACYLDFAEEARAELTGPNQAQWLERLDLERENLLSAHQWCDRMETGPSLGLRLASSMKYYLITRGQLALSRRLSLQALARTQERSRARCRTLFDAGQVSLMMGQYRESRVCLEESLKLARELGDQQRIQAALQPLGSACLGLADFPAARAHLEEAVAMARNVASPRELAAALNALGAFHCAAGNLDDAEPYFQKMLGIMREVGDRQSIVVGLLNLAIVSIGRGTEARARAMLLEAHGIATGVGARTAHQSVLEVCAGLGVLREDWSSAARFYGTAEAQCAETGMRRSPADEAFLVPLIAKARATLGDEAFLAAEAEGRALPCDVALTEARGWLEVAA